MHPISLGFVAVALLKRTGEGAALALISIVRKSNKTYLHVKTNCCFLPFQ